jgi:hypothetical protein
MSTVNQQTINPTRKLTAAVVATAVMETLRIVTTQVWPDVFDQAFWSAMLPVAVFAAGWFIKDEPNVVVVAENSPAGEQA